MAHWFGQRDRVDAAFVTFAALAGVTILWLGLGLTFFSDEWAFIESRSLGDPSTWFVPHNEHWITIPILVYRLLVETVGIGSYVPYLATVLVLHLVVATLVYVLGRRSAGPVVGLAGGILVLFLGSGFENLFWGFQIGFVGSVAAGLGAIAVLDGPISGRRSTVGIALLVIGVASSGIGVTFLVIVGVELLLDARRRVIAPLLGIPVALYLLWYTTFGRTGIATFRSPFTIDAILDAPSAIVAGFGSATGATIGVGPVIGGWVGLIALSIVLPWVAIGVRGPNAARFLACMAAIATQYGLIGIFRAQILEGITNYTRYTYVAAIILIVGASALIGATWTWRTPTSRRVAMIGGGSLLAVALIWNIRRLAEGRDLFAARAAMTRALVTVALERPLPPETDPERSLVLVPSPVELGKIVEKYGSPLGDRVVPWAVRPISQNVAAEALRRLQEGAPLFFPDDPTP